MSSLNYSRDVVVASGDAVSEIANVTGLGAIGLICPIVASCQVFLQTAGGETPPSSASFVRLAPSALSSGQLVNWCWNVGQGSAAATIGLADSALTWLRVECGVVQPNGATFQVVGKRTPR